MAKAKRKRKFRSKEAKRKYEAYKHIHAREVGCAPRKRRKARKE